MYADTSFSQDGQCCLARGVSLWVLSPYSHVRCNVPSKVLAIAHATMTQISAKIDEMDLHVTLGPKFFFVFSGDIGAPKSMQTIPNSCGWGPPQFLNISSLFLFLFPVVFPCCRLVSDCFWFVLCQSSEKDQAATGIGATGLRGSARFCKVLRGSLKGSLRGSLRGLGNSPGSFFSCKRCYSNIFETNLVCEELRVQILSKNIG